MAHGGHADEPNIAVWSKSRPSGLSPPPTFSATFSAIGETTKWLPCPNMDLPIAALSGHVRPRELKLQGQQDSRSATLATPPWSRLLFVVVHHAHGH